MSTIDINLNGIPTAISSGLYDGGQVTINGLDATKIDITAGEAVIADYWTTPGEIIETRFSWSTFTGVTVTNLLTATQSYIAIDSAGAIQQFATRPTNDARRDLIILAQLGHAANTVVASVNSYTSAFDSAIETGRDIIEEFKLINDGNAISANGANLNINKSQGYLFGMGINWQNDTRNPNKLLINSAVAASFRYRTQAGGTTAPVSAIDPTNYDNAGTIASVPAGVNKATNQRVFLFPNGNIVIQYGQAVYNSLSEAIQAIQSETFNVFTNVSEGALLIGIVSVTRGATALNSATQARFIPVSKLGENIGGAAGLSVSTLQQAYNNSTDPEITTDSTRGAVTFKRGSAADTDEVVEVLNGAGSIVFRVTGEGKAAFSSSVQIGAYTLPNTDGTASQVLQTNGAGSVSWATVSSGLTIGTTAITSGTVGRIMFQGAGDVVQQDSLLFWDNTNKRLGVGATPASTVMLDVRAQGALSTDVAFRVRNSANSADLMEFLGNGQATYRGQIFSLTSTSSGLSIQNTFSTSNTFSGLQITQPATGGYFGGNGALTLGYNSSIRTNTYMQRAIEFHSRCLKTVFAIANDGAFAQNQFEFHGGLTSQGGATAASLKLCINNNGNVGIGTQVFGTSATNTLSQITGIAPTTSPADQFQQYSADIIAGNAAPHFRTENNDIVKVYSIGGWGTPTGALTRTTFDTTTVTLSELAERVAALISDLKTGHGLLKA